MYKKMRPSRTSIDVNKSYIGETIEQKVERIVNNKEPISDGAPLIYTDRKDGVRPEFDIRSDRFEVAIDAMDKVTASHQAKRKAKLEAKLGGKKDDDKSGDVGGPESIQGTETK